MDCPIKDAPVKPEHDSKEKSDNDSNLAGIGRSMTVNAPAVPVRGGNKEE